MRKKFIPLSLALCLTLSGCGGNVVLERSYSVSTPHSEAYWENEGADTLRADSYQDAVNAILMLVANHAERGVVRSMSRKANCGDNARAEGFFGTLKAEFFNRRDWSKVGADDFMERLCAGTATRG